MKTDRRRGSKPCSISQTVKKHGGKGCHHDALDNSSSVCHRFIWSETQTDYRRSTSTVRCSVTLSNNKTESVLISVLNQKSIKMSPHFPLPWKFCRSSEWLSLHHQQYCWSAVELVPPPAPPKKTCLSIKRSLIRHHKNKSHRNNTHWRLSAENCVRSCTSRSEPRWLSADWNVQNSQQQGDKVFN